MRYLLTGVAGFIGYHTARRLLADGADVVAIDNLNAYYDPRLKEARLEQLRAAGRSGGPVGRLVYHRLDLADREMMARLFRETKPDVVIHLAAQAGVRYSISNPFAYADSNLIGFLTILEGCRNANVRHLVYASSSSVYGANVEMPFRTSDRVDHPVSLYAATKKANELMAHTYSHLYGLSATGLRFFTVYGPWGRPDMAYFKFTKAVFEGAPIDVYNNGDMARDFTYVDDIVEGILRVAQRRPAPDPASGAPYKVYNIGNNTPVRLLDMIAAIERATGRPAVKRLLPMQPGDVPATWADIDDLERDVGYRPSTPIVTGIAHFVEWYREYYGVLPESQPPLSVDGAEVPA